MATLEIHDADGRVRFVELDRSHPALLGSSPSCDVVVQGEGVCPVHGRIRWKGSKFKVDASPDAEFLEINGRRVVSASLHQGDELQIGGSRIFVMRLDDLPTAEPVSRAPVRTRKPKPREEATKVLSGPPASSSVEAKVLPAAPHSKPSIFERDDLLADLEIEAPPPPTDLKPHGNPSRRKPEAKTSGLFARLRDRWRKAREAEAPPGREVVASSPTVLALVALLAALIGMGFWLHSIINKTIASRTYNRAVELMEDGDNLTAIREFDAFLAKNPEDVRAGKATTLRALANVRQYITISGATWSRALEAAREMFEQTSELPEYRDEKSELGDLVVRIGEGLADRARRAADAKMLAEAQSAAALHAQIAGEMSPAILTKSRFPDLLNEARATIRKAETRAATLTAMDRGLDAKSAAQVYKARDALVEAYGDLSTDAAVVERMVKANDLMRQAVKVDPSRRPALLEEDPDPLGAPTSLVLRSRTDVSQDAPPPDALAYALAEGAAYALDSRTGAPVWRTTVGLASPFAPTPVPGDPSVLMFDARRNELARRDARTGRLIWRQPLGEPVDASPLVLGEHVYQSIPSGKLVVLSLSTGEVVAAIDLAFPVAQTPVGDESGRFLYMMGRKDCLFTISRDPFACVDVQYLGHAEGSIPCAPARLGRFLIVAENDRIADGRWRVLVLDDDGARPRAVQSIDNPGWTWATPPTSGSSVWAIGDRGGMQVFAAGDYSSATPLRSIAKLSPDAEPSGPAFGYAPTEREIWITAGRTGRFDVDAEGGRLAGRFLFGDVGMASAPIQTAAKRVVLSNRAAGGGVALRGVDPTTGKVEWQTVLGAAWPSPLVAENDGENLRTVDQAGRRLQISRTELERGGFASALLPKPGDPHAPNGPLLRLSREGDKLDLIAPGPGGNQVWSADPISPGDWLKAELPASPAARPLPWAGALFVAAEDGRAYLVDPSTGRSTAEPLVPEFERDRVGRWLDPAPLDDDSIILADDAGRIRRLAVQSSPAPRIAVQAETTLDQKIIAAPACTASAVVVATEAGDVRSLAARDLSPIGVWKLAAPLLDAPHAVDGRVVVFDASGGVSLVERDGRRVWSVSLGAPAVGSPLIRRELLWVLDRAGHARGLSVADGHETAAIDLGVQPVGGLIAVGPDVLVPSGRGVLQLLNLDQSQEAKP
ncbi:outer membrane protein assembly factor BamB family protein [Paludisphaera rhizosphaerae]|uniref:outer membrane protein assembly factor BamB family protein n=1 Tax=Paludisphaera rhizosphaerae TaxID=2711216 RepID=UPI0013EC2E9D|nr:PQQ-binding-like beta-propeller repeat protein [Paludisphaera rhizosphaerae]